MRQAKLPNKDARDRLMKINTASLTAGNILSASRGETGMIKDILVLVPTERPGRPVIDASISLAASFDAHLNALAAGYISSSTAYVVDGAAGAAVASGFEMELERAGQRTTAALEIFEAEARNARISYQCRPIEAMPADAADAVGAAARLYDLSVVLQPMSEYETFDNSLPKEVLFRYAGDGRLRPFATAGRPARRRHARHAAGCYRHRRTCC